MKVLESGKGKIDLMDRKNQVNLYPISSLYPIFHKVAYVPPSMRNKVKPGATFKLSEDEPAQNAKVGQLLIQ